MILLAGKNKITYYSALLMDRAIDIAQKLLNIFGKLIHLATYRILVDPVRASAIYLAITSVTVPAGVEVNGCFILVTYLLYQNRLFYEKDGKVEQTFLQVVLDRRFFLKLRRDSLRWGGLCYRKNRRAT